jgi:hypothetical protein
MEEEKRWGMTRVVPPSWPKGTNERMTWLHGNTRQATFLARRKPHAQQQGEQVVEGEERDGKQMMNMSTTAPSA